MHFCPLLGEMSFFRERDKINEPFSSKNVGWGLCKVPLEPFKFIRALWKVVLFICEVNDRDRNIWAIFQFPAWKPYDSKVV